VTRPLLILATLAGLLAPGPADADPIELEDPAGDDSGPGTYRYPGGPLLQPGALDLTAVALEADGEDVIVRATLRSRVRWARGVRIAEDQTADVFGVQVDVYVDRDRVYGSGRTEAIPGRRLAVSPADAWDVAIVLTPLPARLRSALGRDPELARVVIVPDQVRVRGRTIEARVRAYELGGFPQAGWAYGAATSSPTFSTSIEPWIDGDSASANTLYIREVTPQLGTCGRWQEAHDGTPCTFGGCDPCGGHPRVLDVLAPAQIDQAALLRAYDPAVGRLATLPMIQPDGTATRPETGPTTPEPPRSLPVADADGSLLTVVAPSGSSERFSEGLLVDALDEGGRKVGKAVVVRVTGDVVVLELVGRTAGEARAITVPTANGP
jgi:hypothetical protein